MESKQKTAEQLAEDFCNDYKSGQDNLFTVFKRHITQFSPSPSKIISEFAEKISTEDIDPEIHKVVNEKFMDMVGSSSNQSYEKPDFERLADRTCSTWTNSGDHSTVSAMAEGMETIWNDYVTPLQSRISVLEEERDHHAGLATGMMKEIRKMQAKIIELEELKKV